MKNFYIAKLFIIFVLSILAGCFGNKSKKEYDENITKKQLCFFPDNPAENAPSWVCGVKQSNLYSYTLIKVKSSNTTINNLQSQAIINAKVVLLQQIKTYVSNKAKNYIESSNLGGVEKFIKISSIITSNISAADLDNNIKIQSAISNKKSVYVLVGLTKQSYQNTLKDTLEKTLQNNKKDLEYNGIDDKKYTQLTKLILNG